MQEFEGDVFNVERSDRSRVGCLRKQIDRGGDGGNGMQRVEWVRANPANGDCSNYNYHGAEYTVQAGSPGWDELEDYGGLALLSCFLFLSSSKGFYYE